MRSALNLVFIFIYLSVSAQNETKDFITYTTREGLSDNYVRCITQDYRNFLWIGTKEGLNRFDGHEFKKYFKQQKNANSLPDNNIRDMLEYQRGQLLIATNNGLAVLNTFSGEFNNEKIHFTPLKAGSGTIISNIFKTGNGQIWINHGGEIDLLDSNLNYLYRFTDLPWAKEIKGVLIINKEPYTDKQHRLYLVSDTSGIQVIDFASKQVWNYKNNPQRLPFLNAEYSYHRCVLLDTINNNVFYAPWGRGLFKYNLVTHKVQQQLFGLTIHTELASVNSIIQKNERYLLCTSGVDIYEVDIKTLAYTKIADETGITFFRTKDNRLWAGTSQGLTQFKDESSFLKEFSWIPTGESFVPDFCTGLTISKSGRMYATFHNNRLIEIGKDRVSTSTFRIPGQNNIIMNEVCEDKSGHLWIGTSRGVYFFDELTKKFSQPGFQSKELRNLAINVIYCDKSGETWIGTRAPFFLFKVDATQKNTTRITNTVVDRFAARYVDSRVSAITEDKKNNLWMTSYLGGGIINFNKNSGQWKAYPLNDRYKSELIDNGILSSYADENNNLWFAGIYNNKGLMCYNYLTDSIRQFTRDDGLASDYIYNMTIGQPDNFWISSEYGLTQFNLQNHKTVSYNLQNLSGTILAEQETIFDSATNSLVFALDDSLLFIEISHLKKNIESIIPFFDKVFVNNKELFINPSLEKPRLKHDENNISIEFAGVDFSNMHSLYFAYQLSGLDTGWRFSDASRSAQYSNLPPGDYIFKIKTANENNEWSKAYEVFSFTITPIFWKTAWFQIAVILFAGLIIFWLVRKRIQVIRREAELKFKLSETEMMALRSQMNPHFIFNCLNAIDNLIQTNQADKATTYLARFAKLIRSVLESSKSNMVPFDRDYETLRLFLELEQFRCSNKFTWEMKADEELLAGDYKVPPLIIQPFVENAIHHGLLNRENGERKVTIKAALENNFITWFVQDNGVGRIRAQEIKELNKPEHRSYGIQITSERIHLHNQNGNMDDVVITDIVEEGKCIGTAVKVKLKIH